MKIRIAKTLLEPVGIPWGKVTPRNLLHCDMADAIDRYVDSLEEHFMEGLPDIPKPDIAIAMKQIIRNHGIKEVYSGYQIGMRDNIYEFRLAYRVPGSKNLKNIHTDVLFP
jgi:hypothetical protein